MEISESKLDDKNIVETIVQMVQLEFLELELIEQEQKVVPSRVYPVKHTKSQSIKSYSLEQLICNIDLIASRIGLKTWKKFINPKRKNWRF